jgi:HD-GYP domain-containing protein (c-di-GMP phosphodiesterase class II)
MIYIILYGVCIISDEININTHMQTLNSIFFVVITSIFILALLWKNYNTIIEFHEASKKNENELIEFKRENQNENELYNLMISYIIDGNIDSDEICIKIFRYIFDKIEVCDLGSVLKLGKDGVQFIDAVGYDLESLNSMDIESEKFELHTFGLKKHGDSEEHLKVRLGPKKYADYRSKNPKINESIYIGLLDTEGTKTGFALDISDFAWKSDKKTFDDEAIKELKKLQIIFSAMFRMKAMVDIKDLLQRDIVNSFIEALEHYDEYTKGHSESVSKISLEIGKNLGLNQNSLQELSWAAMVHDIGKIVIPRNLLNKNGKLTDEEFEIVKKHTTTGESFLSKSESLNDIAKYVRHHHERWDGKGYPDGLVGEEIPLHSQIICVADSYHAMISDRPYRKGLGINKSIEEIKKNKAKQYSPRVVDAFIISLNNNSNFAGEIHHKEFEDNILIN